MPPWRRRVPNSHSSVTRKRERCLHRSRFICALVAEPACRTVLPLEQGDNPDKQRRHCERGQEVASADLLDLKQAADTQSN